MPVSFGDSSEEDAFPQAQVAPARGTDNTLPKAVLLAACERASARLYTEWPPLLSLKNEERDIHKIFGPSLGLKNSFPQSFWLVLSI